MAPPSPTRLLKDALRRLYRRHLAPRVAERFFTDLVLHTDNFGHVTWLGHPVWQNVFDLWVVQETLAGLRPELVIECGTNRGGSALFFAHLFDLMGHGSVVTVDVDKLHDLRHPRVTFLVGSSTSAEVAAAIAARARAATGPVFVTLDSDHAEAHVRRELELYARLVTPGSWCLVQDTSTDTLPLFAGARPGPLPAVEDFLRTAPEFEVDEERSRRFLISHHPRGWLRRKAT
jgi:cephalosporin hydroxylase